MAYNSQKYAASPGLLAQRLVPRPSWDEYFMALAKMTSTRSTCSSRPVGCVIVKENRILVSGYNGPPPGAPHCSDRNAPGDIYCARRANLAPDSVKLEVCESVHAEENAISLAENLGIFESLNGASLYTTLAPCARCIKRLGGAGIRKVFYEHAYESVNKRRDAEWEAAARGCFDVYAEVQISGPSSFKMASALVGITSERLLPSE